MAPRLSGKPREDYDVNDDDHDDSDSPPITGASVDTKKKPHTWHHRDKDPAGVDSALHLTFQAGNPQKRSHPYFGLRAVPLMAEVLWTHLLARWSRLFSIEHWFTGYGNHHEDVKQLSEPNMSGAFNNTIMETGSIANIA